MIKGNVSTDEQIVLPMRLALSQAVQSSKPSRLQGVVKKCLKKRSGIIFKRQWWNLKTCRTQMTRWYREWIEVGND